MNAPLKNYTMWALIPHLKLSIASYTNVKHNYIICMYSFLLKVKLKFFKDIIDRPVNSCVYKSKRKIVIDQ